MNAMKHATDFAGSQKGKVARPFRAAMLRGLGVLLPPLLTIVIFLLVGQTVKQYVLDPVTNWVREGLVYTLADIRYDIGPVDPVAKTVTVDGLVYRQVEGDAFIPLVVYDTVRRTVGTRTAPRSAEEYYRSYVETTYLRPYIVVPVFLLLFVLVLYLLGKFLAAGIGRAFWTAFEQLIVRLPLIRSVYSAVKQFSDFFFNETEVQFRKVVAIEYPRRGIWSLAFVVSEGFLDVRAAANEPIVAVFVPSSPMPMTGFTITLPKRDVIDLNITIDQAIQFMVSCGVVVPPYDVQREWQKIPVTEISELPAPADVLSGAASQTDKNDVGAESDTAKKPD